MGDPLANRAHWLPIGDEARGQSLFVAVDEGLGLAVVELLLLAEELLSEEVDDDDEELPASDDSLLLPLSLPLSSVWVSEPCVCPWSSPVELFAPLRWSVE